ncbi:MAG TPA: class I SAM-dependent methyltransferase [Bacteroides reticulotermitis]|nr:class I SAM-dependent methyltransferase [Bacteroides reticulotermitis]
MTPLSPETLQFIREHRTDDVRKLALQAGKFPQVDMPTAITQLAGRQTATEKIPAWAAIEAIRYPKHLSLEQCSSEITARYKARLLKGESLADLTGGFGIDCAFLAQGFQAVAYVERQEELCRIAAHNFPLLGLNQIQVYNEDGVEYLRKMAPVACLFLDPARRNEQGGKTVAISDCEPNVAELEELLLSKARRVMIKLSPMLDLTLALKELPHAQEVHIISVHNECKELLILLGSTPTAEIPVHCVNFTTQGEQTFVFSREEERDSSCPCTDRIGQYLFEPNASLLKAGAYRLLTSRYPIQKLHPNSHLYTSDKPVEAFPGRTFRVTGQGTFNKKEMKAILGGLTQANLSVRNFPASVAELRKRIKLGEGGSTYLFATTLNNDQKILIRCEKA